MLQNMFVGNPPGNYDRLLDFSTAVTGGLFFVSSATFLDNIVGDVPEATETAASQISNSAAGAAVDDASLKTGSLNIGSLRGERNE
jgi:putative iron-dependent peroxidase